MKSILTFVAAAFLAASVSYGGAVTNTVKWNVPWGDIWRSRAQETLSAYETAINAISAAGSVTNVTKQTGAVTATAVVTPQAPGAVTPTITVTAQRPGAQTPTITVTKETGAITATATPTLQSPGVQTPTITVTIYATTIYDSTGAACTNAAGEVAGVVTGATATCSALPDFPTNMTVAVSIVGGDAVMTNATAASSALLDYPTNATAICSALPNFATNATAAVTVIGGDAVVTNITVQR